jgi:hypothetical protein
MRNLALAILFALAMPTVARAGAWTLPDGKTELLLGANYSRAVEGYDHEGHADAPIEYEKTLVQLHGEYGWDDWLTLILAPEYAHAFLVGAKHPADRADDGAVEGGARVRLWKDIGIVSAQLTAKTAGAFDMSVSADGAPGQQLEFRMLYGTSFTLFGEDGFFDAEAGQRWIGGARADENPIDLTVGMRVRENTRVMVQSFNVFAQGNSSPPYSYYRVHKLSLSIVTDVRPGLCVESSAFLAFAGQNALAEQGAGLKLWINF